jgi:acyl-CoA synthetase
MTENSSHNFTRPDDDVPTICSTTGRPGDSYELRLFDPECADVEVAAGEVGEICGRGACLMLGYFDAQRATEDSFNRHGWFRSGDLGRLDEHGNLVFVGRTKELIIRGGHNIYPGRLEQLAGGHPLVSRAAAIPVPDERLGERVCLAIQPIDGGPTVSEMLRHLHAAGLSIYEMPEHFMVVDRLPLTASGKVLKRELVRRVAEDELVPIPCRFDPSSP